MVIDALVRHFTNGRKRFDRNAEMASTGELLPKLAQKLMRHGYFSEPPPKTTGREQYGKAYVDALLSHPETRRAKPESLIRTATVVTALSILDAFHRFIAPKVKIGEIIISGGGARNPLLMAQLESGLVGVHVRDAGELGVPGDAKEAFAFAVLAHETLHKRPANVPGATGAKRAVVLGKVCYAR
jgi:anhydro-N-acetylmuramic acid kinase